MGAEDALKTIECIPKPSAGSGHSHFLTEVRIRAGENKLRIKDLVRAVKRVCGLGRVDTPIIAHGPERPRGFSPNRVESSPSSPSAPSHEACLLAFTSKLD